jgi:hypothetical protein
VGVLVGVVVVVVLTHLLLLVEKQMCRHGWGGLIVADSLLGLGNGIQNIAPVMSTHDDNTDSYTRNENRY